ncbi:hypothetical protein QOT17_006511 [Balamuthia mandrillaris]
MRPDSYPYKNYTTLFLGIQWVLQEYLIHLPHQTAIFASTFFSIWEPLMNDLGESETDLIKVQETLQFKQPLHKIVKHIHFKAQQELYEQVLDCGFQCLLHQSEPLCISNLALPVSSQELHLFLLFCYRLCSGNIYCQGSADLSDLVANES